MYGDTLAAKMPYMQTPIIQWLESYLTKDMRVFEWGAGGSTLFISKRVKSLVSIEYGKRWYVKILWHVIKNGLFNCRLKLVLPDTVPDENYRSQGKYGHLTFKNFASAIDNYPDDSFDLIVVDGRARAQCLQHAKNKVKRGGYILLDDADRAEYQSVINAFGFKVSLIERGAFMQRV